MTVRPLFIVEPPGVDLSTVGGPPGGGVNAARTVRSYRRGSTGSDNELSGDVCVPAATDARPVTMIGRRDAASPLSHSCHPGTFCARPAFWTVRARHYKNLKSLREEHSGAA